MEQIHGHEVIQMMLDSGKSYTRPELVTAITGRFGQAVRFYTCAAENLTADGLIDFLEARGKFIPSDRGFQISPEKVCNH